MVGVLGRLSRWTVAGGPACCRLRAWSVAGGTRRAIGFSKGGSQQAGARQARMLFPGEDVGAVFGQEPPRIGNPYLEDPVLRGYLESQLPAKVFAEVHADLERFGARVQSEIDLLGRECELTPPQLKPFDAWGQRVDQIITCPAWKRLKEISAEEGLIAEGYERKHGAWSRVHQLAKMYLFTPSSGIFSCPLAMTDGAAKVIESLGRPRPLEDAFAHLISRNPKTFWTSGQWMTELRGGSDVGGGTETVAQELPDGTYSLHGLKWFTSAADSDMTLTLARVMGADGQVVQGSKGLSLFYLEVRDQEGKLNGIQIRRLKEKLGTRQLPTAELILEGARALRISKEGRGVPSIAKMLTITRIHNVIFAVSAMRRVTSMARDYATKRETFGKLLKDHPLHMQTLARMEVQVRGAFALMMELGRLLGLEETEGATEEDQLLLRLLTPVAKLYTGKQAVAVVSEGLESFGGQGYMEDTGLPCILRDIHVATIWEGTTNILALDVQRSIVKSQGKALEVFFSASQVRLEGALGSSELKPSAQRIRSALQQLREFTQEIGPKGEVGIQLAARDFAYSLARIYAGVLLLDYAAQPSSSAADVSAAQRWCYEDLCPVDAENKMSSYRPEAVSLDLSLVYGRPPGQRGKL